MDFAKKKAEIFYNITQELLRKKKEKKNSDKKKKFPKTKQNESQSKKQFSQNSPK